ncbi:hypothetical protein PSTG_15075 [Puccinia striiformis f. sp. tritici PST-78]|uniref:Uncharacterized protein n=1 Tax=Puccinia striiformis f. sp. tritici PST-78 TaxID=1165861 RepID=A0A0L0UX70_9BASI|nr:hypothetical protein PSTG_15075 [Puccinia striiformis f. sp. tritici PST-78]
MQMECRKGTDCVLGSPTTWRPPNTASPQHAQQRRPLRSKAQRTQANNSKVPIKIKEAVHQGRCQPDFKAEGKDTHFISAINSTGMQDLKIPLDRNGVKTLELQGHGTSWKVSRVVPTLPNPQCDSPNAVDAREMARVRNEMHFYSGLSLWINKGFLSQSIAIAKKGVKYLQEHVCELLQENLPFEKNPVLAG